MGGGPSSLNGSHAASLESHPIEEGDDEEMFEEGEAEMEEMEAEEQEEIPDK